MSGHGGPGRLEIALHLLAPFPSHSPIRPPARSGSELPSPAVSLASRPHLVLRFFPDPSPIERTNRAVTDLDQTIRGEGVPWVLARYL